MATKSAGKKTSVKKKKSVKRVLKAPKKKYAPQSREANQPTWTIEGARLAGLDVALFIDPDELTATQRQQLQDFLDSADADIGVIAISGRHP